MTEQKTITFYDDELTAVQLEGGDIYVPVRRLCDNLGIDWAGQRQRINRDEVLGEALMSVGVITTHIEGSRARKSQDMLCLPLDLIPGWLFGIQTGRVKEEIRPKLLRYRREAFRVLWDAFKADILPSVDPALAPPAEDLTLAEQNLAQVEALHNLARQQVAFERWLAQHDHRLEEVEGATLEAHEAAQAAHARMDALELTISAGPTVTTAQAAAISSAVKALAAKLGEVEPEKGNPYGRVYGRLYRVFSVSSYKAISLETFAAVMTWLADWWGDIADDPAPFGARDVGAQLGMEL